MHSSIHFDHQYVDFVKPPIKYDHRHAGFAASSHPLNVTTDMQNSV